MSLHRRHRRADRARRLARLAALVLVGLITAPATAGAFELFLAAGSAKYEKCGRDGCWQQPPLPTDWRLKTGTAALGLRAGNWETSVHDLGQVSVHGFFVPDVDYTPETQSIREGARSWRGIVEQETWGLSLRYAPRWQWRWLGISPSLGALAFRQHLKVDIVWLDGECCDTHLNVVDSGVTPTAGLELSVSLTERLRIGLATQAAWRLRTTDAPAGGGNSHRPGVMAYTLVVRHIF